ncbi:phosphatidylserine decarboxylase [Roseiconus nitratireducens]|uniref:phosphatidylserine decarboxylase n=1 Tax=Roseiconus nitratireducens TaxID=2605748 RepID=A0A5M6D5I8_9BACT|nr:archaetidylserine decarboxylase [Roseiconus nitratireducens]KAA5542777.1 phosphatidylserine decarboxylase [Roseiconus nitratireducens]
MDEIVFFDRYRQQTCVEKVYGDKSLRWTYGSVGGKIALATVVKRLWFSRFYGWLMDRRSSREKIAPFIERYEIDADEFVRAPDQFENFNAFFYRRLKPQARPIDSDPTTVVFPADGRHLCIPDLSESDGLLVKGERLDLETLVADADLARHYARGSLLVSRLCPVDYHRFHFPVAGCPGPPRHVNGPLYSVNPIALRQNIQILATNRRVLTVLDTETIGRVLLLEIGATCVGGICQTYSAGLNVSKGDEKGYFRFGASSTIVIFEPGRIRFDDDLLVQSQQKRELYAHVGDHMGTIL